jgi:AraC family transcriptional regulator, arabinose operon regulatory protein
MKPGKTVRYRQEGFSGQRLVVLPPTVVEAARRHPLLGGLLPTDAGFFSQARGHWVERPEGAPGHVLILCLAGRGCFRLGTESRLRPVVAGDALLLPAEVAHAYGTDDEEPWSIEWAHFIGTEATAWRAALGLAAGEALFGVGAGQAGEIRLGRVHPYLDKGYGMPDLLAASAALRTSLVELVRRRSVAGSGEPARDAVARGIERLLERLDQPAQLAELAAEAGLSVSHYSLLFRAQTGYAPIDYFLRMRMQRAAQLLDTTELRVEEIGTALGYEDPNYFSRQFRRFIGKSPRAYRAVRKG